MSKKIVALISMLLVISLVLPSCAKGGDEETTIKETEAEVTEPIETPDEETTEAPVEETTEGDTEPTAETVVLTDLDGAEKVYQIIASAEIEGVKYVALLEASLEDEELDAKDAQIYRVELNGDEESFILVEDADELNKATAEMFAGDVETEDTAVDKTTDSTETTASPETNGGGSVNIDISISGGSDKNTSKNEETKKPAGDKDAVTEQGNAGTADPDKKDPVDGTQNNEVTTKPSVDVSAPEETTVSPETTEKPAETTTPANNQTEPVTETTYPLDTVIPLEFVTTLSGKVLVHTISDRTTNKTDDNSNTLAFIPMKDKNAVVNWNATQNQQKVNLATVRPGAMLYGVLVGYDNYLFYKDTLNDFIGVGELNSALYDKAVKDLKARNDWVEANGKKFYFVIAPNKNSVYPDYMPEGYTLAEYRRYDQFVKLLGEAGITAVDLRETMTNAVKANPQENLYYKYDTHWNNHAGYHAYRRTMDLIDDDFPNVVIHDRSEYQINYAETYMKDLCWYTGNYDRVVDYGPVYTLKSGSQAKLTWKDSAVKYGQYEFSHIDEQGYSDRLVYFQYTNEANADAPNIYVMRDSYSIALVPFMKDSFYKSTFNWTWNFDKSDITESEADIVMVIVAERNLRNYVNNKAVVD